MHYSKKSRRSSDGAKRLNFPLLTFLIVLVKKNCLILSGASQESSYFEKHDESDLSSHVSVSNDKNELVLLEEMTIEELEKICTSRGFELVREMSLKTGELINYTHQDYIDAAYECLQIEADIEEILTKHPEILIEVKIESERIMVERDMLKQQLNQITMDSNKSNLTTLSELDWNIGHIQEDKAAFEALQSNYSAVYQNYTALKQSPSTSGDKPMYDLNEIALEVIQRIKSDFTNLLNIVAPKKIRQIVKPALETCAYVANDLSMTVYNFVTRYLIAIFKNFINYDAMSNATALKEGGQL